MNPECLPDIPLLVHADWGVGDRKRWATTACLATNHHYQVSVPEPVCEPTSLIPQIETQRKGEACLLGFDFPIGLPLAYAQKTGIQDFRQALLEFGTGDWADFYHPAETPDQITLKRPFYPNRPGGCKQEYLLEQLGVDSIDNLRRRCESGYRSIDADGHLDRRRPASPLFWTLGGQQVGKAAILGWEKVLAPTLREGHIPLFLWPFDGRLSQLAQKNGIIALETYPAEYYSRLGIHFLRGKNSGGKRSQAARVANAQPILDWCASKDIDLSEDLGKRLCEGFGDSPDGEDKFDSLVGLLGMMSCLRIPSQFFEPDNQQICQVEGWIFGMRSLGYSP